MKQTCLILIFITLIGSITTDAFAQTDTTRMFIFGHSLIDHRPPSFPTPSDETTVPHWIFLLGQESNHLLFAGGQYGFLPQHANLPPISQWGYDIVPGVWESDTEPYRDADISTVLITAGNFIQWQPPNIVYPTDPGITPISATRHIIDWVAQQEDSVKFYIYENWPDMAPFLNSGFPPTEAEWENYHNNTQSTFHGWWLEYQDSLLLSRPDINIRMIPVGPIISKIFTDIIPLQIPYSEYYEDDAHHGRATIYFLAGLITYMGIYEELAPTDFIVPGIIHQSVKDQYHTIVNFIWNELETFRDENGNSRVFFSTPITSIDQSGKDSIELNLFPNPTLGQLWITTNTHFAQIDIMDAQGLLIQSINTEEPASVFVDLRSLPDGVYHAILRRKGHAQSVIKSFVKIAK